MPEEFKSTQVATDGEPHSPSAEELEEIAGGLDCGETLVFEGEIELEIDLDEPEVTGSGDVIVPAAPELVPYGQPALLLTGWIEQRDKWIAIASAIEVASPEGDAQASAALSDGTKARTSIEKALKKHLEAPKAAIKRVQEFVGELLAPLEKAEQRLKDQLAAYRLKERDARLAAEGVAAKALAEARASANAQGVELSPAQVIIPAATPKGSGTRTEFRLAYKITNHADVPRHLCSPDPALIQSQVIDGLAPNAFTSQPRALPDHPYIEVWIDSSVAATGRKKRT